jgi:exopolyphosphatase/guanosine-5'-triphosphate,3'-diphosphate pyrophosphatase
MAALARGVAWTDRAAQHGVTLTLADTEKCARELADTPLAERLRNPCLQPGRADIVVHGICILLAVTERFGIGSITVSEWGNMDGYLWKKLMC